MPASLELSKRFGDDLAVLLVEVQGLTQNKTEAFAYDKKWMGSGALWTTEAPFEPAFQYLPQAYLISNEGELLLMGLPFQMEEELVQKIEQEIAEAKKAPKNSDRKIDLKIRRADWQIENLRFEEAGQTLQGLAENIEGDEKTKQRVKELQDRLSKLKESGEAKAAQSLREIERKIQEEGFEESLVQELQRFAEKHRGTLAAEKASHLAALAEEI